MKALKYIFSISLVIWGLLLATTKLFLYGLHFPVLTVLTISAIMLGISKNKRNELIFFVSACLWVMLSGETIGFFVFFDSSIYDSLLFWVIPLILGVGLIISSQPKRRWINSIFKRLLIIPILIIIGIGSYVYKPTVEEVNCWYYFEEGNSYRVSFAESPERKFEATLSSEILKNEVKKEGLQSDGREGYYCPETKIRVITSFGNIISARIISFRNSETDKNIKFSSSTKIPLDLVEGNIEILKPITPRLWN